MYNYDNGNPEQEVKKNLVRLNSELKYMNYEPAPIDPQTWIQENFPTGSTENINYCVPDHHLNDQWHRKNQTLGLYEKMTTNYDKMKRDRESAIRKASAAFNDFKYTEDVAVKLEELRDAYTEQYQHFLEMNDQPHPSILKNIKNHSSRINVLSLFAGMSPEVTALLDLGFYVRIYVLDYDADALGVPMFEYKSNPRVEFYTVKFPGNKRFGEVEDLCNNAGTAIKTIQRHCGGIHLVIATPPCTTYSLAGNCEGDVGTGRMFGKSKIIFDHVNRDVGHTFLLLENTNTSNINKKSQQNCSASMPNSIFTDGVWISPFSRKRFAWVNFPPAKDLDLNGNKPDCLVSHMFGNVCPDRAVHTQTRKFNTMLASKKPNLFSYRTRDAEGNGLLTPVKEALTVEQATYMFGYTRKNWEENSYGQFTAGPGIMKRWNTHQVTDEWNGIIVDLNGVANDDSATKRLSDLKRFSLLGFSVMPGMMKDLLKSLKEMFLTVEVGNAGMNVNG